MTTSQEGAIRHPMNRNAYYRPDGEGGVLVSAGERSGRFRADGSFVSGSLFEADPELCLWVAQPRPATHHRLSRITEISGER
jgi:hypothetical protein